MKPKSQISMWCSENKGLIGMILNWQRSWMSLDAPPLRALSQAGTRTESRVLGEGTFDGFGHLHLPGTELVTGVPFGQRPATAKKLTGVSGAGLSGHRDALSLSREQANFVEAIGRSRWNRSEEHT